MLSVRKKIYIIIFQTNTRPGKGFDILLLVMILLSVGVVIIESVQPWREAHPAFFISAEWFFTAAFTIEYLLRIYSHPRPLKYMTSFLGIIDLIAILPTYFGLVFDQANFLLTVRAFRLLRVFRILKLTRFMSEADLLATAIRQSLLKIVIFFEVVLVMVLFMGTLMYMVEGEESGFTSIPQSIYWAIVTITTVGYGDIAPVTVVGKFIASLAMLTGYSIIAIPTGIFTMEIGKTAGKRKNSALKRNCPSCNHSTGDPADKFCSRCGTKLE
jgi:voltage-gated potassium channel